MNKNIIRVVKRKKYNQFKSDILSMHKTNYDIKFNQFNTYLVIKNRFENNFNVDVLLKNYFLFFNISVVEKKILKDKFILHL